ITKEAFRKAIVPAVFEPLESFMRKTFRSELARMIEAGIGSNDEGVRPRHHIQRVVFDIWARLFFGIEPGTPEFARLRSLYLKIDFRNRAGASDDEVRAAIADIEQLLRERASGDGASMNAAPRSILAAMSANGRAPLDDPTISGNLIYLMHFSWGDVSGLLQWIFRMLTEHHEWAERLRAASASSRSEQSDGMSLSSRVVMETLRLEQMEHLYRVANQTITHDDVVIPEGWLVRVCVRESHRDPTVFEDPEKFDPDRFLARSYQRREYAPFGAGLRRACLGEGLSRHVGRIFAEELAQGYRWRTVSDGPYEYGVWRHWRPSSDWRVMLTPVG
ncbi:MAG: cytochrome P450, partial [Gemmatimonadales bacterium]